MVRGVTDESDLQLSEALDLLMTNIDARKELFQQLITSFGTLVGPGQCIEVRQKHDGEEDETQENGPAQLALTYETRALHPVEAPDDALTALVSDDSINWTQKRHYKYCTKTLNEAEPNMVSLVFVCNEGAGQMARVTWRTDNLKVPATFVTQKL